MNHQTVEFIARDRIADMRREADRPRRDLSDADEMARRHPRPTIRLLALRLHLAWRLSPRNG